MTKLMVGTIALLLVTGGVEAQEFALHCTGNSTTFNALSLTKPTVQESVLPEIIYIVDEPGKKVWRWLPPLQKRDPLCDDSSCSAVFAPGVIKLMWFSKGMGAGWLVTSKFQLNRVSGLASWSSERQDQDNLLYSRYDMICEKGAMPAPGQPTKF